MTMSNVHDFFKTTPQLGELCSQNGWPDPESLQVDIETSQRGELMCSVSFDEVIMEGAGCEAGRIACWGRYRVQLDEADKVIDATLESGSGASAAS